MEPPELVRENPIVAHFVERPNRFVIRCRIDCIGEIDAYMPNPGRLGELLIPGATMLLEKTDHSGKRKLSYTACAVYSEKSIVGLNTHRTNQIAKYLLQKKLIPGLEEANLVDEEVSIGRSRFDFLLEENGIDVLLEVKSVSLSRNGISMFPDAVTPRGTKHLIELAALGTSRLKHIILFVSQNFEDDFFMPDFHTDLAFSRTIVEVNNDVRIIPVAIKWNSSQILTDCVKTLHLPWEFITSRLGDTGSYLLSLEIPRARRITVGSLGTIMFKPGYYLYVGSGMGGLSARINRHLRRRKNLLWHVDFLRDISRKVKAYPVRTPCRLESALVSATSRVFESVVPGFGASDSKHVSHLFYSPTDPFLSRSLHELLGEFRFIRP